MLSPPQFEPDAEIRLDQQTARESLQPKHFSIWKTGQSDVGAWVNVVLASAMFTQFVRDSTSVGIAEAVFDPDGQCARATRCQPARFRAQLQRELWTA